MNELTGNTRMMSRLMKDIKQFIRESKSSLLDSEKDLNNAIATFNSLALPRGYVHVDDQGLVHLVFIRTEEQEKHLRRSFNVPFGIEPRYIADVIWNFDPFTGIWNVTKDRTGEFERLCPIKCGGMPMTVPSVQKV